MGLFGPEWDTPPTEVKPKRPKKPRKRPIVPDWLAELLACGHCGRPRVTRTGEYAACPRPGCAKLIPRSQVNKAIAEAREARAEANPDTPELVRCLRMAWRYLRGKMRRKGEPC